MTYAQKHWGDCSNAVAYQLNFEGMCFGYPSDTINEYYSFPCEHCEINNIQNRDYEYPKSSVPKRKDYFMLDNCSYAVKKELMEYMISFGVNRNCFRPIHTRKIEEIIAYQITPINIIDTLAAENGLVIASECKHCGAKIYEFDDNAMHLSVYGRMGYPAYINKEELSKIKDIAKNENGDVFISLDLYKHLLKKYPKFQCRPVFLGDIYHDEQYIRFHNTDESTKDDMIQYSLLEFYYKKFTNSIPSRFEIGVFETEKIKEIIEEYIGYDGFNNPNGTFVYDKTCYIDKGQEQVCALYIWHKGNFPKWDDDLNDYDYDTAIPDHIEIARNEAIIDKHLDEYKRMHNTEIMYLKAECLTDIKYWQGGFI